MSSRTSTELHAGCSGRVFVSFLPEPFAKTRLVSQNPTVGSGAPPSISSASYRDHDSLLRTPRRFREAGCPLKRSASTCDHGMTRAALHASDGTLRVQLCVRFIFPQHPVHPDCQLACDHDLGWSRMFLRLQPAISAPQLFVEPRSRLRGFHQQRAHHGVALLADRSETLMPARRMLARDQSQVTGHLLASRKSCDRADGQHIRQSHHRSHARMRHQQPHFRPLLGFRAHRTIQFSHLLLQAVQHRQQIAAPPRRPSLQRQLLQHGAALHTPQTPFPPHALVQRQVLQLVLHLRADFHQLLPVPQQLPHIAHLLARHPQPGKSSVDQQIQNVLGIATVGLLLPHHQPPNLRRISDPQLVPHLGQHLLEPLRVAYRFYPHSHRLSLECLIETPCFSLLVFQSTFPQFASLAVDQGDLLVARMKITSYNLHCGSFLPEPWFWQTQVYSEGSRSRTSSYNQAKRGISLRSKAKEREIPRRAARLGMTKISAFPQPAQPVFFCILPAPQKSKQDRLKPILLKSIHDEF